MAKAVCGAWCNKNAPLSQQTSKQKFEDVEQKHDRQSAAAALQVGTRRYQQRASTKLLHSQRANKLRAVATCQSQSQPTKYAPKKKHTEVEWDNDWGSLGCQTSLRQACPKAKGLKTYLTEAAAQGLIHLSTPSE